MNIILICILFLIIILSFDRKREDFLIHKIPRDVNCLRRKNYANNIFSFNNEILIPNLYVPEIVGDETNRKKYKFYSDTILNKDIIRIIRNIPKKTSNIQYQEIYDPKKYSFYSKKHGTLFNYKDIQNLMKPNTHKFIIYVKKFLSKNLEYTRYNCSKMSECEPKVINFNLIKIEKSDQNIRITFIAEIYIKNKAHSYLLEFVCEINNDKHIINSIELIGNRFQDKIDLLPGYENKIENVNIYSSFPQHQYNMNHTYYRDSDEKKILSNDETIKKILKKKKKDTEYSCIGKIAYNKQDCEDKTNELHIDSKIGIWDKKCNYDSECPFYQSNKNYPNRRGKCINGTCEFPLGIKRVSFRKYDKKHRPICYNCKKGYDCCNSQLDKKKYPKLSTPDYIFNNDFSDRNKYSEILAKKNLKVI